MGDLDLTSVEGKLDRAAKHYYELEALTGGMNFDIPLRRETDEDGTDRWIVASVPSIDPEVPAIVGDYIHNLRCVLDHLTTAIDRATGGPGNLNFPMKHKPRDFTTWVEAREGRWPDDVIEVYRSRQPKEQRGGTLRVLGTLDNTDKHDALHILVMRSYMLGTVTSQSMEPGDMQWHSGELIAGHTAITVPATTPPERRPDSPDVTGTLAITTGDGHVELPLWLPTLDSVVRTVVYKATAALGQPRIDQLGTRMPPSGLVAPPES